MACSNSINWNKRQSSTLPQASLRGHRKGWQRIRRTKHPQGAASIRKESQDGVETTRLPRVITVLPERAWAVHKRIVGCCGLEPPRYLSGKTPLPTQDDAESEARSAELEALIESWGQAYPAAVPTGKRYWARAALE